MEVPQVSGLGDMSTSSTVSGRLKGPKVHDWLYVIDEAIAVGHWNNQVDKFVPRSIATS